MANIDLLTAERLKKLESLKNLNIDTYPHAFPGKTPAKTILDKYSSLAQNEESKETFKAAGRIVSFRSHGKTVFFNIKDESGQIQVYLKLDTDNKKEFSKALDIGDFIGIEGTIFKTHTGEITIFAKEMTFLSKSLMPLPEKWHGLKDVELRYRQRYLDLLVNDDVKKVFYYRSKIIKSIRDYLEKEGFLEVETPMMQPLWGGATARPFITHHNTLDMDLYLRVAPELYLKRLLVGSFEKVYEINRNFRNEGISTRHNPEFTMIEIYQAYVNYKSVLELCQNLIVNVAKEVFSSLDFEMYGKKINLTPPWNILTFEEALKKIEPAVYEKHEKIFKAQGHAGNKLKNKIFEELVEPSLIQPTFITDYPIEFSPLSKTRDDNSALAERFELFIGGQELGNAYSEQNDPIEQRKKLEEQLNDKDDETPQVIDEDFVHALEYGMPPAAGLGIGIDRLVMTLCNCNSIRDVILFPHMKKEL
ncbi:MAG: lysine--tRNA ligase [bacterium]|nr:lysine--tRNA ligase [bacterium]